MPIVSIDIGTRGCKVAAVAPDASVTVLRRTDYALSAPAPGLAELDPTEVILLLGAQQRAEDL